MQNEILIELTADIVAAHVANNSVSIGDMGSLVQQVHGALAGLSQNAVEPEPEAKIPVVSIRASVKPEYIVCMECGRKQQTLRRHLQAAHGMTPEQYRKDYGLPDTYPMTAPGYSEKRRAMAKSLGLGRKPQEPEQAPEPAKKSSRKPRARQEPAANEGER